MTGIFCVWSFGAMVDAVMVEVEHVWERGVCEGSSQSCAGVELWMEKRMLLERRVLPKLFR